LLTALASLYRRRPNGSKSERFLELLHSGKQRDDVENKNSDREDEGSQDSLRVTRNDSVLRGHDLPLPCAL
jgi:hypothetical protein